jgi:methionine salvage enolase-phosphatase E1
LFATLEALWKQYVKQQESESGFYDTTPGTKKEVEAYMESEPAEKHDYLLSNF